MSGSGLLQRKLNALAEESPTCLIRVDALAARILAIIFLIQFRRTEKIVISKKQQRHPPSAITLPVDVCFTPESGDAIGMSALCQQQPLPSSLRRLSALWCARSEIALGAEDVAVKACNPLPPPRGHIQVLNGGLDMRRNSFPIKLRV